MTNLEGIEDDVELDRVLSAHPVIHLAGIGRFQQDEGRDNKQSHLENGLQV